MLRTGTNDEPMMMATPAVASSMKVGSTSNAGFESLSKPAVWRHSSSSATDTVRAMEKNGMETYDIPAFLRKQAD
jgi:cell division protein FtsZ